MTAIEDARELRAHALAARESRQKAGIAYESIQVPIDVVLALTAPPTDDERKALRQAVAPVLTNAANFPEKVQARMLGQYMGPLIDRVVDALAGFRRQGPITDAQVGRVAEAIARTADADYWTTEIAEWEGSEDWEREAHPDNYPDSAYEDREWYRKQARAALEAAATTFQGPPTDEWEYGNNRNGSGWDQGAMLRCERWEASHRRHPAIPAGPWEPVEAARDAS